MKIQKLRSFFTLIIMAVMCFSLAIPSFADMPESIDGIPSLEPGESGGVSTYSISSTLMKQVQVVPYNSSTNEYYSSDVGYTSGSSSTMNVTLPSSAYGHVYSGWANRYQITLQFSAAGSNLYKYEVSVGGTLLKTTSLVSTPNGGTFTVTVDAPSSISTLSYNVTVKDTSGNSSMVWGQIYQS